MTMINEPGRVRVAFWLALLVATVLLSGGATLVWATIGAERHGALWSDRPEGVDVTPPTDELYLEECGGCHFAYPPGLLPARGWDELIRGLEDHFGDNAELMDEDRPLILDYLIQHAAETSDRRRSVQVARSIPSTMTPIRISEVPYIKMVHEEIPARLIDENPKVEGRAYCDACHVDADKGYYNDANIEIPGYGRWND